MNHTFWVMGLLDPAGDRVPVALGVEDDELVGVAVGEPVGVTVGERVGFGVIVGLWVGVGEGISVGVGKGVLHATSDRLKAKRDRHSAWRINRGIGLSAS